MTRDAGIEPIACGPELVTARAVEVPERIRERWAEIRRRARGFVDELEDGSPKLMVKGANPFGFFGCKPGSALSPEGSVDILLFRCLIPRHSC